MARGYAPTLRSSAARQVLAASTILGRHRRVPFSTMGRLLIGCPNFIRDLEVGVARGMPPNFGVDRYDRLMGALSWAWPADLAWPATVPRPAPVPPPPERAGTAAERLGCAL